MRSFTAKLLSSMTLAGLLSLIPVAHAETVLGYHGVNLYAELGQGVYVKVYDRHGRPWRSHRRSPPYWHRPHHRPPPRWHRPHHRPPPQRYCRHGRCWYR